MIKARYIKSFLITILTIISLLSFTACTNSNLYSGNTYTGYEAKTGMEVQYGTITHARDVNIQADNTGFGGVVGAAIGGVLGGDASDSSVGSAIGSIVGGAIGGIVGNKAEDQVNQVDSIEYEVKLDSGTSIIIVQKADTIYQINQRVRVIGSGQRASIAPIQ